MTEIDFELFSRRFNSCVGLNDERLNNQIVTSDQYCDCDLVCDFSEVPHPEAIFVSLNYLIRRLLYIHIQ